MASTGLVLTSNGLIIIGVVIRIGVAMQPEAIVAATLAVSQERKFYDKPHVYFEDRYA